MIRNSLYIFLNNLFCLHAHYLRNWNVLLFFWLFYFPPNPIFEQIYQQKQYIVEMNHMTIEYLLKLNIPKIALVCPFKTHKFLHWLKTSHKKIYLSCPPLERSWPLGLNLQLNTSPQWPVNYKQGALNFYS